MGKPVKIDVCFMIKFGIFFSQKLLCAVYLYGEKEWEKVAEYVPGRTIPQCRERYKSSLGPKLRPPDFWTYEEDKQLLIIAEQLRKPGILNFVINVNCH